MGGVFDFEMERYRGNRGCLFIVTKRKKKSRAVLVSGLILLLSFHCLKLFLQNANQFVFQFRNWRYVTGRGWGYMILLQSVKRREEGLDFAKK